MLVYQRVFFSEKIHRIPLATTKRYHRQLFLGPAMISLLEMDSHEFHVKALGQERKKNTEKCRNLQGPRLISKTNEQWNLMNTYIDTWHFPSHASYKRCTALQPFLVGGAITILWKIWVRQLEGLSYIYMIQDGGWPTLWKMMEFVSWDDENPNMLGKSSNSMVPNHQPDNPSIDPIINHH